ncbi:hypothetical protein GOV09_04095 [Candidatus Woesearchaeota archaeon]|nr:hypothetical protein [Candidatus Woesearchaeota archaeon]
MNDLHTPIMRRYSISDNASLPMGSDIQDQPEYNAIYTAIRTRALIPTIKKDEILLGEGAVILYDKDGLSLHVSPTNVQRDWSQFATDIVALIDPINDHSEEEVISPDTSTFREKHPRLGQIVSAMTFGKF